MKHNKAKTTHTPAKQHTEHNITENHDKQRIETKPKEHEPSSVLQFWCTNQKTKDEPQWIVTQEATLSTYNTWMICLSVCFLCQGRSCNFGVQTKKHRMNLSGS